MSKQHEVKSKLKVLQTPAFKWVVCDILQVLDDWVNEEKNLPKDYANLVKKVCEHLEGKYKDMLIKTPKVMVRDLEDLIQEIKKEGKYAE